jgi:hypothetical protein
MVRPAVPRRVLSRLQPLTASTPEQASATRQAWHGCLRVMPPGTRASPPADSVTMRCLRPALSMTRRWPRTGSACRLAIRCRNAGSPRCSDAPPAAGREPGSPMPGKHRSSQQESSEYTCSKVRYFSCFVTAKKITKILNRSRIFDSVESCNLQGLRPLCVVITSCCKYLQVSPSAQ